MPKNRTFLYYSRCRIKSGMTAEPGTFKLKTNRCKSSFGKKPDLVVLSTGSIVSFRQYVTVHGLQLSVHGWKNQRISTCAVSFYPLAISLMRTGCFSITNFYPAGCSFAVPFGNPTGRTHWGLFLINVMP